MKLYRSRGWRAASLMLAGILCGSIAAYAWTDGKFGLLIGALLSSIWLAGLGWWNAAFVPQRAAREMKTATTNDRQLLERLLFDAVPTPVLWMEEGTARAFNRAARGVFATDDRILPKHPALFDPTVSHLQHEGRRFRIDRVEAPGGLTVAALIDVEREEQAAEARAGAELIEILGHELLNGLAPIISLAESAHIAASRPDSGPELLREILGPLARRAEGLQRFVGAYRELARLPTPKPAPVVIGEFTKDISSAFAERWPDLRFDTSAVEELSWQMDRDQMNQAVWALLNNAAEAVSACGEPLICMTIGEVGDRLSIIVSDNGQGVPPQSAAKIFRPFHTTKPEGSGIGLWLARQIARAHGGSLSLAGYNPTTFEFSLP